MKVKDPAALADRLRRLEGAATTPLIAPPPIVVAAEAPATMAKPKAKTTSVFLRVPDELHVYLDGLAMARTRETGRGVTIQQIILEQLDAKRGEA